MIAETTTQMLPITTMTASALGLLVFALAMYTMSRRVIHEQPWGDGDIPSLRTAIRAHGNLIEYAPIFLILMALLERRGASPHGLLLMGGVFVSARLIYLAYALVAQKLPLRILGFWGSVTPIAAGAIWALVG